MVDNMGCYLTGPDVPDGARLKALLAGAVFKEEGRLRREDETEEGWRARNLREDHFLAEAIAEASLAAARLAAFRGKESTWFEVGGGTDWSELQEEVVAGYAAEMIRGRGVAASVNVSCEDGGLGGAGSCTVWIGMSWA